MTGGGAAERLERSERSPRIVGGRSDAAGLIGEAAALGVRLEARPGGRLWADKPDLLPIALRDSLAAHRTAVMALLAERDIQDAPVPPARARGLGVPAPSAASPLPGVPLNWCRGVALLATLPAPPTISPRRWVVLAATSARLLHTHGAELHAAGWDTLDLWGLHALAPTAHPPGWGLAWLLGELGEVLDVAPSVIGMRWGPDGARLALRRAGASARAGTVPAWTLLRASPRLLPPAQGMMTSPPLSNAGR